MHEKKKINKAKNNGEAYRDAILHEPQSVLHFTILCFLVIFLSFSWSLVGNNFGPPPQKNSKIPLPKYVHAWICNNMYNCLP